MNLQHWLSKTPRPVAVLADDKRIEVPNNRRAWKDLTATIKAMEVAKVTALDAKGNVIRSVILESDEDDKPASTSAEMSDLQLFAKLVAEAYDKGSRVNQPVIDSAMQFVERQGVRLQKAESEIDRLRLTIHKQNLQIAEISGRTIVEGDGEGGLFQAMLAGALQSGALTETIKSVVQPDTKLEASKNGAKNK